MGRGLPAILSAALMALSLAACDQSAPAPPANGPPPTGAPAAAPPAEISSADGGAEQTADTPLPAGPTNPAQPGGPAALGGGFEHHDAGDLIAGSGPGYLDRTVWSPSLCFPLESVGYANSQVYGAGGGKGPPGLTSQCDRMNYTLPWRDNFCEARGYASPVCAGGHGHQGQDIRPATCKKDEYWVVAAEDGIVTDIGSYTVTLTAAAPPHRVYRYLHMEMADLSVHEGASVHSGDRLGKTSNNFGATPTTVHLHFEIRAGVSGETGDGKPVVLHTFLPPYLSLIGAYQRKLDGMSCH
jgi:murein DD-endopeptidase MepM/ murein hydrolase activator NlpD